MPAFAHFILTRFNLGMRGNASEVKAWHDHRFSLFEQFCLPSVKGQTNQSFIWLLFCDNLTPPAWLQVIHDRNLQVTKTWGRRRVRIAKLREDFELEYEIPSIRESAVELWVQNMRARAERLVIDALSEDQKMKIRRRLRINKKTNLD